MYLSTSWGTGRERERETASRCDGARWIVIEFSKCCAPKGHEDIAKGCSISWSFWICFSPLFGMIGWLTFFREVVQPPKIQTCKTTMNHHWASVSDLEWAHAYKLVMNTYSILIGYPNCSYSLTGIPMARCCHKNMCLAMGDPSARCRSVWFGTPWSSRASLSWAVIERITRSRRWAGVPRLRAQGPSGGWLLMVTGEMTSNVIRA